MAGPDMYSEVAAPSSRIEQRWSLTRKERLHYHPYGEREVAIGHVTLIVATDKPLSATAVETLADVHKAIRSFVDGKRPEGER